MRKIEVSGAYQTLELFTAEDVRREVREEWEEIATQKTELHWPVPDFVGFDAASGSR